MSHIEIKVYKCNGCGKIDFSVRGPVKGWTSFTLVLADTYELESDDDYKIVNRQKLDFCSVACLEKFTTGVNEQRKISQDELRLVLTSPELHEMLKERIK